MKIIDAARQQHAPPAEAPQTESPLILDEFVLQVCREQTKGRSVDPMEVAIAFAARRGEEAIAWRKHLPEVRRSAVRLATASRLVILRKGKPVDPSDFKGVYRLALPSAE
jgi:Protein of unknown function (DUF3253)